MKAALPLAALGLSLILGLAACAPAAKAPPQARPVPAPSASAPAPRRPASPAPLPAPVSNDWMDAPLTPGGWRYERLERTTVADFRSPENRPLVTIACLNGGQLSLEVRGARAGSPTIRTETATRTLLADANRQYAFVLLSANDPLLDAMALSKGRFAIEVEGQPPLILPSWAEVSRVVEDCR